MLDYSKYDAIEKAARERLKDERLGRFTAQREAKDAFKADLEKEYLDSVAIVSDARKQKLFDLAWEEGHTSGYGDVEHYYSEFSELVLPE